MARELGTRVLATVLFTDIVGSTAIAEELSDSRWRELLRRHHAIVRRELRRFRGREIDTAGDGFFAVFDSPAQAVRCACAIGDAVRELGIEIRAGLHLGEVELTDGKAQGIAVHIGSRILALAKPGDVLVSAPLRTTVAGSGVKFEARGRRRLKGVEGTWQVFSVAAVDGEPRMPALEPEEAARRRGAISPVAVARRPTILVAATVAAAAVVAVSVLMTQGEAPPRRGATGPPVGSLVRIDPRADRVEQVIRDVFHTSVGQGVRIVPQLAAGEGSVWILGAQGVSAVDPGQGDRWGTTPLGYIFADQGFGVGYRAVWLRRGTTIERINPATGDLLQPTTHPDWTAFGGGLVIGSGGVWVVDRSSIFRLAPQSGEVIGRIDLHATVDELATGEGSLWVADDLAGRVLRIDPRRGRVLEEIPLTGGLDELAVGEGSVWVLDSTAGTLTSIQPDTGTQRAPVRVGGDPTAIAVGFGSVWVAGGKEETVLRINPNTLAQETILVGGPVSDITVDDDERVVWVTVS
jgi:class 3 adenylate cyclase/streptogramin lyase